LKTPFLGAFEIISREVGRLPGEIVRWEDAQQKRKVTVRIVRQGPGSSQALSQYSFSGEKKETRGPKGERAGRGQGLWGGE